MYLVVKCLCCMAMTAREVFKFKGEKQHRIYTEEKLDDEDASTVAAEIGGSLDWKHYGD